MKRLHIGLIMIAGGYVIAVTAADSPYTCATQAGQDYYRCLQSRTMSDAQCKSAMDQRSQECFKSAQTQSIAPTHESGPGAAPIAVTRGSATSYVGKVCAFFTKPLVESGEGVTRMNHYAEGAKVCLNGAALVCRRGRWDQEGICNDSPEWRRMTPEYLEK